MSSEQASFDTIRRIATALPGVRESTAYGMPALKLHRSLLATLPANRSLEPNTLVVRVSPEQREELLAVAPDIYYLTEHYQNYDFVLVRLSRISEPALQGLLKTAFNYVSRISTGAAKATRRR